jgi:hypothetical protein
MEPTHTTTGISTADDTITSATGLPMARTGELQSIKNYGDVSWKTHTWKMEKETGNKDEQSRLKTVSKSKPA